MKDKIKIILSSIIFLIFIVVLVIKGNSSLELFKNTKINDNKKIEQIINLLDYNEKLEKYNIEEKIIKITYDNEFYKYHVLEKNSSILFYLIDDVEEIVFLMNDNEYVFKRKDILSIYDDINIKNINKRYENEHFESLYLGNINGDVDIFDTSELCVESYNKLLQTSDYTYYITCASIDEVIVVKGQKEYLLRDAIDKSIISVDDLFKTNIKITKDWFDKE